MVGNFLFGMMTSSNGIIFRVTGPLCGEFTGPGEFPTQRPVTRSFDVFFDLRLNKRLSKQPWGLWFETPPWSLWRQCNAFFMSTGWQWIAWMGLMDGCLYVWANVCRWLDADYICILFSIASSRWRHNGRDGVSNHQPHDCLLNRLLRRKSKKARKLYVTGLCAGNYNHVNAGYNNAAVTK